MMSRVLSILIPACVLLFCVYYLVVAFEWESATRILLATDPALFVGAASLMVLLFWLLRALRWFVLLRALDVRVPFAALFLVSSVSLALTVVTPFQSGEVMKIEWLKRQGHLTRTSGYGGYVLERVMDLWVILVFALGSMALDGDGVSGLVLWLTVTALGGLAAGRWVLGRISPSGRLGAFAAAVRGPASGPRQWLTLLAITVATWLVVAGSWQLLLLSIGIETGFLRAVALAARVTLINVLSMIPGAVGISEVGIAETLRAWGHPAAVAQAGALVIRLHTVLVLAMGAALVPLARAQRVGLAQP